MVQGGSLGPLLSLRCVTHNWGMIEVDNRKGGTPVARYADPQNLTVARIEIGTQGTVVAGRGLRPRAVHDALDGHDLGRRVRWRHGHGHRHGHERGRNPARCLDSSGGFKSEIGQEFPILTCASRSSEFAHVDAAPNPLLDARHESSGLKLLAVGLVGGRQTA